MRSACVVDRDPREAPARPARRAPSLWQGSVWHRWQAKEHLDREESIDADDREATDQEPSEGSLHILWHRGIRCSELDLRTSEHDHRRRHDEAGQELPDYGGPLKLATELRTSDCASVRTNAIEFTTEKAAAASA